MVGEARNQRCFLGPNTDRPVATIIPFAVSRIGFEVALSLAFFEADMRFRAMDMRSPARRNLGGRTSTKEIRAAP